MNKICSGILFIFLLISYKSMGQRNIIDVPTSEVVEKNHVFFQEQIGIADRHLNFNTMFTYGLGKNWEAGLIVQRVNINMRPEEKTFEIDPHKPETNTEILMNIQKVFPVTDWYTMGLGNRSGFGLANHTAEIPFITHSFFNNSFKRKDTEDKLIIGCYYGNYNYVSDGNKFGIHLALEKELISDKLEIFGELISGINATSVINIGFQVDLPKDWEIDLAAQLPSPHSGNDIGFIFQLARR